MDKMEATTAESGTNKLTVIALVYLMAQALDTQHTAVQITPKKTIIRVDLMVNTISNGKYHF